MFFSSRSNISQLECSFLVFYTKGLDVKFSVLMIVSMVIGLINYDVLMAYMFMNWNDSIEKIAMDNFGFIFIVLSMAVFSTGKSEQFNHFEEQFF